MCTFVPLWCVCVFHCLTINDDASKTHTKIVGIWTSAQDFSKPGRLCLPITVIDKLQWGAINQTHSCPGFWMGGHGWEIAERRDDVSAFGQRTGRVSLCSTKAMLLPSPSSLSANLYSASSFKTKASHSTSVEVRGPGDAEADSWLAKWRLCSCPSRDRSGLGNCLLTFLQQNSVWPCLCSREGVFLPTKSFSLRCHLALRHQDSIKVKNEPGDLMRVGRPQQVMGQLPRALVSLEAGGAIFKIFFEIIR